VLIYCCTAKNSTAAAAAKTDPGEGSGSGGGCGNGGFDAPSFRVSTPFSSPPHPLAAATTACSVTAEDTAGKPGYLPLFPTRRMVETAGDHDHGDAD
jgi:hypothetical protein